MKPKHRGDAARLEWDEKMYLIVPAETDLALKCRIVYRPEFSGNALRDYRENPKQWVDVGHMNSQGKLIAFSGPKEVAAEFRDCEPLMAGL